MIKIKEIQIPRVAELSVEWKGREMSVMAISGTNTEGEVFVQFYVEYDLTYCYAHTFTEVGKFSFEDDADFIVTVTKLVNDNIEILANGCVTPHYDCDGETIIGMNYQILPGVRKTNENNSQEDGDVAFLNYLDEQDAELELDTPVFEDFDEDEDEQFFV